MKGDQPSEPARVVDGDVSGGRAPDEARVAWVDAAKAVSILLVVAWHTNSRHTGVASLLIFVPMPLFFFISGFFARDALKRPPSDLRGNEGLRLLYLYALWAAVTFLLVAAPRAMLAGTGIPWERLLLMFVRPFDTLWFTYALAITFFLAQAFSRAPLRLTGAMLAVLYAASVADGAWFRLGFPDRVVRLMPFFFLGVLGFPWLKGAVPRLRNWWPLFAAAYLALAWGVTRAGLTWAAPLTFAASLAGIAAMLTGSAALQRVPGVSRALTILGASTLGVYLLHRIVLFYWRLFQDAVDMPERLRGPVSGVAVIAISLVLGAAILRYAPWMFGAPWRRREARRQAVQQRDGAGAPPFTAPPSCNSDPAREPGLA